MPIIELLTVPLGILLALSWLLAVASGVELVAKHPAEGKDLFHYIANGTAWFGPEAFAPSGAAARKRMHGALVVFFTLAFGIAAIVVASELL